MREAKLIPLPEYGSEFSESSARAARIAKAKAGKRTFEAKDLKKIIDKSNKYLRPVIMLGINGGMGAKDISLLTLDQFEIVRSKDGAKLKSEWLHCPRNKTGMDRRIWLWPETRKAIECYLAEVREEPFASAFDDTAFLTKHRTPWTRENADGTAGKTQQRRCLQSCVGNAV